MLTLVTRAQPEAARWVGQLQALGVHAQALPLIEILPVNAPDDIAALQRARRDAHRCAAVMFVSASAVAGFFEENMPLEPMDVRLNATKTRALATGPGTAAALRRAGVEAGRIDHPGAHAGQFDSEALWQVMGGQVQPGDRVLIVRGADAGSEVPQDRPIGAVEFSGGDDGVGRVGNATVGSGRDWFANQLLARGAQVHWVASYRRCAPRLDAHAQALALQAAQGDAVWLFSSSQAIGNLVQALPHVSWARSRAVATHPRIAQAAHDAGVGVVCVSRAAIGDVVASIESFR